MRQVSGEERIQIPTIFLICLLVLTGCGDTGPPSITVYCGRNAGLIQPLLDRFTAQSGVEIEVRYGSTFDLTATLLEEGASTPAALFISRDAAALGALSEQGLLRTLPDTLLELVPPSVRSQSNDWIGLSGRARVVVYNTKRIKPEDLPQRLEQVTEEGHRGRFGIAPTDASYRAHMTVFHALHGEAALEQLLKGMVAIDPIQYTENSLIVEAVIAGEIDWGLVDHTDLGQALKENPDAPARNYFMPGQDGSTFVHLAGAALLGAEPAARELLDYLLGPEAQRYFVEETHEYPLIPQVAATDDLPALDSIIATSVGYRKVAAVLDDTQRLIRESGLTP